MTKNTGVQISIRKRNSRIKGWIQTVFVGLVLSFFPFIVAADVYRWVDEKGVVHFSDMPPPQDAEEIRQAPELFSGDGVESPETQNAPESSVEGETTGKKTEESASPEGQQVPGSETMTQLKKNLKVRTSSHQQRKFQRRIKAQQFREGIEPEQAPPNP